MKKIMLTGCLLVLTACMSWYKPGARPGEFEQDKYQCLQESQQIVGPAQVYPWGGPAVSPVQTNETLFGNCMYAKGWSLQKTQAVQAQIQQQQALQAAVQSQFKSESDEISEQGHAICANPDFKLYYAKTACLAQDITFEQLADASKITPTQKVALVKQRAAIAENQKARIDLNSRAGGKAAKIADATITSLIPQNDQNNLELYNGKITWGQYNQRRKDIYLQFMEKIKNF